MLTFTSCQAPNADPACRSVIAWLGRAIGQPVTFDEFHPWQERARRFDEGAVDVAWQCGAWYVTRKDTLGLALTPLVAPVMAHPRYRNRPVYFSDIVVRRDAPFTDFASLRGAVWAFNEPDSHSGYHVVRHYLASLGERAGYFDRVIEAGSHQAALALILKGSADAAAIDSTVLETELALQPGLGDAVRIVTTLGPSPMPPWVARGGLDPGVSQALRQAFTEMHLTGDGRAVLALTGWESFAPVADADYDPLRSMLRLAEGTRLGRAPGSA